MSRYVGLGRGLKRREDGLQCVVINITHLAELAHEARQVWCGRRRLLDRCRCLLIRSVRHWRSVRLRSISSWRWITRLLGNGALGTKNQLRCNLGVQVLVLVEANIVTNRPIKDLEWDLGSVLGAHVELDYRVYTFKDLTLYDRVSREARIEEHGIHSETSPPERSLHPLDKVFVDILHQENLNIGHVVSVPSWNIELVTVLTAAAIRTRTPAPVGILTMSSIWVRRSRSLSLDRIV